MEAMSTALFSVNYDGPALEGGEMDIADLAPALLALGKLFEEANKVINGEKTGVSVKVRSGFKKGSFEVELHLIQGWLEQVKDILFTPEAGAVGTLCGILGFSVKDGIYGLFNLIKTARGRQPERARILVDGNIELTFPADDTGKDEKIEVDRDTLQLFRSIKVRKCAEQTVRPLSKMGIDTISVRPSGTPKEKAPTIVTKSDLLFFQAPDSSESLLVKSEAEVAYSIVSLSFNDDNKWKLNDGQNIVWASIDDSDFIDKVNRNEVVFAKGDILVCEVVVQQWQTDNGLRTETHIIKVKSHRHPSLRQIELPFDPPDQD